MWSHSSTLKGAKASLEKLCIKKHIYKSQIAKHIYLSCRTCLWDCIDFLTNGAWFIQHHLHYHVENMLTLETKGSSNRTFIKDKIFFFFGSWKVERIKVETIVSSLVTMVLMVMDLHQWTKKKERLSLLKHIVIQARWVCLERASMKNDLTCLVLISLEEKQWLCIKNVL